MEEEWIEKQGRDERNIALCVETKEGKPIGNMGIHKICFVAQIDDYETSTGRAGCNLYKSGNSWIMSRWRSFCTAYCLD